MSQISLARACELSLGTVNSIVTKLERLGTIEKKPLGFRVIDPKKILVYWASIRDLEKDIIYATYSPHSVRDIEPLLPAGSVPTAYSAYQTMFGSTPADYEEVYVYGDESEIKRAFPPRKTKKKNLFVLDLDPHLKRLSHRNIPPLAQIYVDLWQFGTPAKKFVREFERKLELVTVRKLEEMIKRVKS